MRQRGDFSGSASARPTPIAYVPVAVAPAPRPGASWKAVIVLAGAAVAIYALSPGARYAMKHGHLPRTPDEEAAAVAAAADAEAKRKGFATVADYEDAVRKATAQLEAAGYKVTPASPNAAAAMR